MRIYDIIKKKRDGFALSEAEINYFVGNYTNGHIPDYQISALLMAIYLNKMNHEETLLLTRAMINSGDTVDLSDIKGIKVDKHSTGGVGDTTTLILGPMVAACGVPFVKMSGRGLGHTGGTLDKLESIKGFNVNLDKDKFIESVNNINIAITSQTANITPADKKFYSLRDVTGTVEDLSLISSSIMSKKLAIESDGIVLDVKVGSGAFMKNIEDAKVLAREMVALGNSYGRKTIAVVTNMDEPLGRAVGNSLEVKEAINTLQGKGPSDLYELCLVLGSKLLVLAKRVKDEKEGRDLLVQAVQSGSAYEKFKEMVFNQEGDISYIDNPELFPKSKYVVEVKSKSNGFVKSIDAEEIGKCALLLGAGRETLDSNINQGTGLILNKKIDDKVNIDEVLVYIHTDDLSIMKEIENKILETYEIGEKNTIEKILIYDEIFN